MLHKVPDRNKVILNRMQKSYERPMQLEFKIKTLGDSDMRWIVLIGSVTLFSLPCWSAKYSVTQLQIQSIAQEQDDEEASFTIRSNNKFHKCGGKSSNLFVVHSEYERVGYMRFTLAIEAMKNNWPISISTKGCNGRALNVEKIRLDRP